VLAQELLPDLLRLLGFAQLPGAEAKPEAHPRLQGRCEGLLQLLLQRQLGATPVALQQERTDLLPGLLLRAQWRLIGQPEPFQVRGRCGPQIAKAVQCCIEIPLLRQGCGNLFALLIIQIATAGAKECCIGSWPARTPSR